jgi:hypothetical protein
VTETKGVALSRETGDEAKTSESHPAYKDVSCPWAAFVPQELRPSGQAGIRGPTVTNSQRSRATASAASATANPTVPQWDCQPSA